jgi:hypothetical protein
MLCRKCKKEDGHSGGYICAKNREQTGKKVKMRMQHGHVIISANHRKGEGYYENSYSDNQLHLRIAVIGRSGDAVFAFLVLQ